MPRRVTIDTNLRMFQYKILNNVLYLNETLVKFKIVSSLLCSFCNSEDETPINHKIFWSKFQVIKHRVLSLVFQIMKKVLKSSTICILCLSIICLNRCKKNKSRWIEGKYN